MSGARGQTKARAVGWLAPHSPEPPILHGVALLCCKGKEGNNCVSWMSLQLGCSLGSVQETHVQKSWEEDVSKARQAPCFSCKHSAGGVGGQGSHVWSTVSSHPRCECGAAEAGRILLEQPEFLVLIFFKTWLLLSMAV